MQAKRILLIDDEFQPANDSPDGYNYMWYYADTLRRAGCQLTAFALYKDALKAVADDPSAFDLAVIDIMLPPIETGDLEDTTEHGISTGISIALEVKKMAPAMKIVGLTNRNELEAKSFPQFDRLAIKSTVTPSGLLSIVEELLDA